MKRGLFWPPEATKREKSYSLDWKILCLDLKIVSFVIFWPPEAENNILALKTKKFFLNFVFVFSEWESFLASGGHKTGKILTNLNSALWWPKKNLWPSSRAAHVRCQLIKFWVKSLKDKVNFCTSKRTTLGLERPYVLYRAWFRPKSQFVIALDVFTVLENPLLRILIFKLRESSVEGFAIELDL